MAVNTQPNSTLTVTLDDVEYQCQFITTDFKPPGVGASTVTETACPDGRVAEPGAISAGALTGEVFADSLDTGITWVLAQAYEQQATLTYVYVLWPDLGPTKAMQYSGECRVNSFSIPFQKPGIGRHPIDLEIVSATLARPAAA